MVTLSDPTRPGPSQPGQPTRPQGRYRRLPRHKKYRFNGTEITFSAYYATKRLNFGTYVARKCSKRPFQPKSTRLRRSVLSAAERPPGPERPKDREAAGD